MNAVAVQFKPIRGDKTRSLSRLRVLAEDAARGADLVVLPEMAATGYLFPSEAAARRVAEPARGETLAALGPVAAAHGCWLVVGFPERDADRLFNSALVIDPSGALAFTYRKTLLFDADRSWAAPGDSGYRRFDTDAGAFGVGVCMDLNDPRFVAWCAGAALDVIALPTNWLEEFMPIWPYWKRRIAGTGATLVAANTWGAEGPLLFAGRSAILDAGGVRASAPWQGDRVVRARVGVEAG